MSNAVPFTVDALQIASISPTLGAPGTQVTFTGSGFGSLQGAGTVALGSTAGQVVSWSDTQVVATVAQSALSGIARIQQNGLLSNASYFLVQVPGGNPVTLMPSLLNMMVGDQRTLQALGPAGLVTGLAWTSSDPTIVSLSPSDPPVLTALAAGHVTITAGTASADVTVWDPSLLPGGALPLGTVIWSNPGDGSGVQSIVPAVPSTSGVADVFAFQADGTVQAITSDGTTAWTATVGWRAMPDFQGGLVTVGQDGSSIYKLDGITGQAYPAYTWDPSAANLSLAGVHPDGTIFAIENREQSVIGIDPTTGTQKFNVRIPIGTALGDTWQTGGGALSFLIAGDGNAYVPYTWRESTGVSGPAGALNHFRLLRVSSAGAYDDIPIYDWNSAYTDTIPPPLGGIITNADQGVVLTFWEESGGSMWQPGMAITTGTSVSMVSAPQLPGGGLIAPVLQAQDGSFVGTTEDPNTYNNDMVAFDATGNTRWIVPNETPQIATADGGVIGQSGITYDQNGNAMGQMASLLTYSWLGYAYQGDPAQVRMNMPDFGLSFGAIAGGSLSPNGAAVKLVQAQVFLPVEMADPSLGETPYTSNFAAQLPGQVASTKMVAHPLAFGKATASGFMQALTVTNSVVAFVGHAWSLGGPPTAPYNAIGLCFGNECLAPTALAQDLTPPAPYYVHPLPNGFAPKAKVVFLAACGINSAFEAQWTLNASGQALIVPVYTSPAQNGPGNPNNEIHFEQAALDLQFMLQQLSGGVSVGGAVDMVNTVNAGTPPTNYKWTVIPQVGRNVTFKTPSN